MNPLWPHLLHFCWLCFHLLFKLPCLHLPHPAPNPPTHPPAPCFQGDRLRWGEVYRTSPKLCKAESEASHLQISKERMLSRSENIFRGGRSATEHQGQRWEMWAKAKPEVISDAPRRPVTKGLQLGSPRVPLSLSLSLPSSSGMSLRCRSQASSSRDHSRSESGPHQALPSSHLASSAEAISESFQRNVIWIYKANMNIFFSVYGNIHPVLYLAMLWRFCVPVGA